MRSNDLQKKHTSCQQVLAVKIQLELRFHPNPQIMETQVPTRGSCRQADTGTVAPQGSVWNPEVLSLACSETGCRGRAVGKVKGIQCHVQSPSCWATQARWGEFGVSVYEETCLGECQQNNCLWVTERKNKPCRYYLDSSLSYAFWMNSQTCKWCSFSSVFFLH